MADTSWEGSDVMTKLAVDSFCFRDYIQQGVPHHLFPLSHDSFHTEGASFSFAKAKHSIFQGLTPSGRTGREGRARTIRSQENPFRRRR